MQRQHLLRLSYIGASTPLGRVSKNLFGFDEHFEFRTSPLRREIGNVQHYAALKQTRSLPLNYSFPLLMSLYMGIYIGTYAVAAYYAPCIVQKCK